MNTLKSYISESLLDIDNIDNSNVLIEEFLKENYNINGIYTIKDGVVNIKGDITAANKKITHLTNRLFQFGEVERWFDCGHCESLETLEGAPREVGMGFFCNSCKSLKSLKGAPWKVGGSFNCNDCNSLKTIKGAPKKIGCNFYCQFCDSLTSLKSDSQEVGGDFDCSYCDSLTSIEGVPRKVGHNFYCHNCGKQFTEEEVKTICNVKNNIIV